MNDVWTTKITKRREKVAKRRRLLHTEAVHPHASGENLFAPFRDLRGPDDQAGVLQTSPPPI